MNARDFILGLKMREERWAFTDDELKNPQACTAHDEFIAYLPEENDPGHIGIVVYRNGEVSNRWGDGTRGVSEEVRKLAYEEDSIFRYDPDDPVEVGQWRDVTVDSNGNFVSFA